ncbi:MAG: CHAT domain-containing protein [Magnetococcales bacterium]|nr:CHAT domain-containing protein [Magnetococcales bacterium]
MSRSNTLLALRITPHDAGGVVAQWSVDGFPLPERVIGERELDISHHVADACRQLLKSPGSGELAEDAVLTAGIELFYQWLAPEWEEIARRLPGGMPVLLAVASQLEKWSLLPWEALRLPDGGVVGLLPRWSVQRRPAGMRHLNTCRATLPGPLRILFTNCAPTGFAAPDTGMERAAFAKATPNLQARVGDTAQAAKLAGTIHQWQPHVVHLSGIPLIRGTHGFFAFEEEDGQPDVLRADEMGRALFHQSGVGLVVVSGRETGHPPPTAAASAVCEGLVASGAVPMALAWPETLSAVESVPFLHKFFEELAASTPVEQALNLARNRIVPATAALGRPGWLLAAMHAKGEHPYLFNKGCLLP